MDLSIDKIKMLIKKQRKIKVKIEQQKKPEKLQKFQGQLKEMWDFNIKSKAAKVSAKGRVRRMNFNRSKAGRVSPN